MREVEPYFFLSWYTAWSFIHVSRLLNYLAPTMMLSRLLLVFSMDQFPCPLSPAGSLTIRIEMVLARSFFWFWPFWVTKLLSLFQEKKEVEPRLSPTRAQNQQVHKFTLRVIWASRNMDLGCPKLWKFKKFIMFLA